MDLIEAVFRDLGAWVQANLPSGAVRDMVAGGILAGIAGTVVFVPQICLLFFLISLLEDTGYSRAPHSSWTGCSAASGCPATPSCRCSPPTLRAAGHPVDQADPIATIAWPPSWWCRS